MKKIFLVVMLIFLATYCLRAQIETPVKWAYALKKIDENMTEIHLLATIQEGWHIYAQKQPVTSIATPTKIIFDLKDGLKLINTPVEIGKRTLHTESSVGIASFEYEEKVDFVQKVKIPAGLSQIRCKIRFQSCNNQMCLPTDSLQISIPLK